jgi:hypothetical protein
VQKFQYTAAKAYEKRIKRAEGVDKAHWRRTLPPDSELYSELVQDLANVADERETNESERSRKADQVPHTQTLNPQPSTLNPAFEGLIW